MFKVQRTVGAFEQTNQVYSLSDLLQPVMGHDGAAGNNRLDRLPSSREIFGLCQYCDELWTNRGVVCIIGSVSTHSSSSSNSLYRLRVLPVPPSYAISSTVTGWTTGHLRADSHHLQDCSAA